MTSPRFDDRYRQAIRQFISLDRLVTIGGTILLIVVKVVFIESELLWAILPFLLLLLAALSTADRLIESGGSVDGALVLIIAGNWAIAFVVSVVVPFLWPVMVLTVLMPLVLATPHLERAALLKLIVCAALVAAVLSAVGLVYMGKGVAPEIGSDLEVVIVILALSMQIMPIGLIVWQNNRLQFENLDRAIDLNDQLLRSQTDLAASRLRVVHAGDIERRRILRDLHDGAQQSLLAVGVRLRLLERQTSEHAEFQHSIEDLIGELDAAIENVRDLAHGIYPPLLQSEGLVGALDAAARGSTIPVRCRLDDTARLDPSIETALYFTALEALTNAAKHAPSSTVDLVLVHEGSVLRLSVVDDGPGFIVDQRIVERATQRMGDRIAAVGGDLRITSTVGVGTTVMATVPRVEADEN